jgi:hypothetical protein
MKIYKQEIADGIDGLITSQASVTYASVAEPCSDKSKFDLSNIKSVASIDDKDLYYVQSILVSSSWNKNDDIFDKAEIWKAKNTPEDKPTNLEHDESLIIGHITSNYPIDENGEIIPVDTPIEELPDEYHILTGSVIYRAFTKPDMKDMSDRLVAEIENGTKYVSMECYFNNFDYGLRNVETGEYKVLAREEDTSHLTKHLRAYGGTGEHEGYTIGRVLRNITFSGKGFVDKPANVDSIIFSKTMIDNFLEEKKSDFEKKGVIDNKPFSKSETNIMNLEDTIEKINTKLDTVLTSEAFQSTYTKASDLETKVAELESSATEAQTSFDEKYSALEAAMKDKEEEMKKKEEMLGKAEEEKTALQEALDAANEVLAGYKQKEEEMAKKEKMMKRMASLIEAGLDNDAASAAVEKFDSIDDDSFDAFTSLLAAMKPAKKKVEEEKEEASEETTEVSSDVEEKAEEESVADASDLENVEVEPEVSLAVSDEEEAPAIETTRAALVDFVKSRLQTK